MTNEKDDKKQDSDESLDIGFGIVVIIVALIFFARAGYQYMLYSSFSYGPELVNKTADFFNIIVALFYVAAGVGFLMSRRFGYTLAIYISLIDILFGVIMTFAGFNMITGIASSIIIFLIAFFSEPKFKPKNKTDTRILLGLAAVFITYLLIHMYAANQPTTEEYVSIITSEAIQKNDIKICDRLDENRKKPCLKELAITTSNSSICYIISGGNSRDACFLNFAATTKNHTFCEYIDNQYEKNRCGGI